MPLNSSTSKKPPNLPEKAQKQESDDDDDPLLSDRESSSDESLPRELLDKLADQKKLDERFTSKQLAYLNERKEAYRSGSANQRSELAQATGQFFLKQVIKKGRDPSKEEIASLYDNVKLWYSQRARSRHGPMHWTINWTGRQVFYKENAKLVVETQKTLFELETGKETEGGEEDHPDLDPDLGGDVAETRDPKKPVKLFHFFQRALTAEWNALTSQQREEYEAKALVWREKGPSLDERRRRAAPSLAEKECGRVIHEFADEIYRQMGVRLHFLVSYEDTSGEHVAFSLDFNNQIDNGASFKQMERGYLEKIDLEGHYAAFVRRTLPEDGEMGEGDQPTKRPRKRGDPAPLELDQGGLPIIPDISSLPQGVKAYRYLPDLIRSIMRHDHACARGLSVSDPNSSPPWKEMALNWRKWISEDYWPDGWPVGDPSTYGVERCRTVIQSWYDRQQRGEIPFQFHSYWKGGENWEPRVVPHLSEDESPKRRPGAKGKKRSKGSKKTKAIPPVRGQRPTSTARQSATSAVRRAVSTAKDGPNAPPLDKSTHFPAPPRSDSDGSPPPAPPPPRPRPRAKSRSKQQTIHSDEETAVQGTPPIAPVSPAETPGLQKLIGKTAGLSLKTPSREASVLEGVRSSIGNQAETGMNANFSQDSGEVWERGAGVGESSVSTTETRGASTQIREGDELRKETAPKDEGAKLGEELTTRRQVDETGMGTGSRNAVNARLVNGGEDTRVDRGVGAQEMTNTDGEEEKGEGEEGEGEEGRDDAGESDVNLGGRQRMKRSHQSGEQHRGKVAERIVTGAGDATGELRAGVGTQANDDTANPDIDREDPGSASTVAGGGRPRRKVPVEDRQLLESAAAHFPLTAKRTAKKKVQFGSPAAEPRTRSKRGK